MLKSVKNGQEKYLTGFQFRRTKISYYEPKYYPSMFYVMLRWFTNENRLLHIISFFFIDSVPFYKEEFDTLCNLQIFTYLLVFHPYYRIRIQRTQSANNHGQLKKYGRTQRTFFMERGREELLVDQCKYCHFDRWSRFLI